MVKTIGFDWLLLIGSTNILLDTALTSYALQNGFYEMNPFTNSFGLVTHMIVLMIFVIALSIMGDTAKREIQQRPNKIGAFICFIAHFILSVFCMIWTVNNMVSVTLLVAM